MTAFPLTSADAFNSRPLLIGSQARYHPETAQAMRRAHGVWQPGDCFWLLTDAVAAWFLAAQAAGKCPSVILEGLLAAPTPEALAAWLADLRQTRQIRNDDTTLLRITLRGAPDDA